MKTRITRGQAFGLEVTTTPPPPCPKEGYLPSPRPPPDIGRGLNRSLSGRSDIKVSATHQRVAGRIPYATELRLFMRASPAIQPKACSSLLNNYVIWRCSLTSAVGQRRLSERNAIFLVNCFHMRVVFTTFATTFQDVWKRLSM